MNGADYLAQVELYDKERDEVVAAPGETCERVNPISLPWLAEQGLILLRPAPVRDLMTGAGFNLGGDVDTKAFDLIDEEA
jgi:hypothetical protein